MDCWGRAKNAGLKDEGIGGLRAPLLRKMDEEEMCANNEGHWWGKQTAEKRRKENICGELQCKSTQFIPDSHQYCPLSSQSTFIHCKYGGGLFVNICTVWVYPKM